MVLPSLKAELNCQMVAVVKELQTYGEIVESEVSSIVHIKKGKIKLNSTRQMNYYWILNIIWFFAYFWMSFESCSWGLLNLKKLTSAECLYISVASTKSLSFSASALFPTEKFKTMPFFVGKQDVWVFHSEIRQ